MGDKLGKAVGEDGLTENDGDGTRKAACEHEHRHCCADELFGSVFCTAMNGFRTTPVLVNGERLNVCDLKGAKRYTNRGLSKLRNSRWTAKCRDRCHR